VAVGGGDLDLVGVAAEAGRKPEVKRNAARRRQVDGEIVDVL